MLSNDIHELQKTFESWARGAPYPTIDAWHEFGRKLRHARAKAALMELGVDSSIFDLANVESLPEQIGDDLHALIQKIGATELRLRERPGVVQFPASRIVRRPSLEELGR